MRGDVVMKKRRRLQVFTTAALTVVFVVSLALGAGAATGTKNLSAIFRNIQIVVNGAFVQAEEEPFIINGRTYVPLRVISEALGAWVDWNQATSMITIKGGSSEEVEALKAQIAQKDALIANLQAQLDEQKGGDIKTLQKSLIKDYDELKDVEIDDIRLSGNKEKVTVNIDVDLDDFDREWRKLKNSDIKGFVEDICEEIQDFYSSSTNISGKIKDIDSNDTLVTFSKSGKSSLSISYKDDDYRDSKAKYTISQVVSRLKGKEYSIKGVDFEVDYISYKTSTDVINVRLVAIEDGADDISKSNLKNGAKDICEDIADTFIKDAGADPKTVKIELYDEDEKSLADYEYDVEDETIK